MHFSIIRTARYTVKWTHLFFKWILTVSITSTEGNFFILAGRLEYSSALEGTTDILTRG